jgi:hypothetical protein
MSHRQRISRLQLIGGPHCRQSLRPSEKAITLLFPVQPIGHLLVLIVLLLYAMAMSSWENDIFSFGLTLYELVAHRCAFPTNLKPHTIAKQLVVYNVLPTIPMLVLPYVQRLIRNSWKHKPGRRQTFGHKVTDWRRSIPLCYDSRDAVTVRIASGFFAPLPHLSSSPRRSASHRTPCARFLICSESWSWGR